MRTLHTPAPNTIKERIDEIIRTKPLEKPTRPLICPKDQCWPLSSYSRLEEEFLNLAAASGKSKTPQMREALLVWNWPLYSLSASEGAACALRPPATTLERRTRPERSQTIWTKIYNPMCWGQDGGDERETDCGRKRENGEKRKETGGSELELEIDIIAIRHQKYRCKNKKLK